MYLIYRELDSVLEVDKIIGFMGNFILNNNMGRIIHRSASVLKKIIAAALLCGSWVNVQGQIITSDIASACPGEAIEFTQTGFSATAIDWERKVGSEWVKEDQIKSTSHFVIAMGNSNMTIRAKAGSQVSNELTIIRSSDCKSSCIVSSSGDYITGTDFDRKDPSQNKPAVPDGVESYFDQYHVKFENNNNDYFVTQDLGSTFGGQYPILDNGKKENSYYVFGSKTSGSTPFVYSYSCKDFHGQNYRLAMRMYVMKDKGCSSPEAQIKLETGIGQQTLDRAIMKIYDNDNQLIKQAEVLQSWGSIKFNNYINGHEGELLRLDVTFYGYFPEDKYQPGSGTYNGLPNYVLTPLFQQFDRCYTVAIDYLSAEVENVCLSPQMVCAGTEATTIAYATGFDSEAEYKWEIKNEKGVWEPLQYGAFDGKGDDHRKAVVPVARSGKIYGRVVVKSQGFMANGQTEKFERIKEFTVTGKDCDPIYPDKIQGEGLICAPNSTSVYSLDPVDDDPTVFFRWTLKTPTGRIINSTVYEGESEGMQAVNVKGSSVRLILPASSEYGDYTLTAQTIQRVEDGKGGFKDELKGSPLTRKIQVHNTPKLNLTLSGFANSGSLEQDKTLCPADITTKVYATADITNKEAKHVYIYKWTGANTTSKTSNVADLTWDHAAACDETLKDHKVSVTAEIDGVGCPAEVSQTYNFEKPVDPTIDCSKINGSEYVLGETEKTKTIDLPLPIYSASCDPDPKMSIEVTVKDLDGKVLSGTNQSRTITFSMSQATTINKKVVAPAGTVELTYTITDGCGKSQSCSAVVTVKDETAPNVNCDLIRDYTTHLKNQKGCVAIPGDFPSELPNLTAPRLEDLNKVDGFITGEYIGRREQEGRPSEVEASFSNKNDLNDPYNKGITWILWKFSDQSGNFKYCLQKITVIDDKKPNVTCPTIDDLGKLDVDTLTCTLKPSSVIAKLKEVSKLPYGFDECSSTPTDSLVPTLYYRIPKEGKTLHELTSDMLNDPIFETGIKYELVWIFKKFAGAYVDETVSVECAVSFMVEDQDPPEFDCSSLTDIFVFPNYTKTTMVYDNYASGSGQDEDNPNKAYTLKEYFENGMLSMHDDVKDVCGGPVTVTVSIKDYKGLVTTIPDLKTFKRFRFESDASGKTAREFTVKYTFTDVNGNTKSCEQVITVARNMPPVPDCDKDPIVLYKDDKCSVKYSLTLAEIPTASVKYYYEKRYGECNAGKPVTTKTAGIKFEEFTRSETASKLLNATVYPDSVRLYDANGNVVVVKNPLTTTDKIVTKSVWFRYFSGDGVEYYCAEDVEYGSAEANISNFKTLPSIVNNYNLPVGENRYVWYFSNAYDKSDPSAKKLTDSCVVTVIVKDTISPVLDCSIFDNPKKFYADESCELSQADVEVENLTVTAFKAKDNCTTDPADFQLSVIRTFNSRKISSVVPPYDILKTPYKVGVTTLEWVVTDESGNSASCLQTIEVLDTIGPKVDCDVVTPPLTAYADANCVAEADIVKKVGLQIPEIDDDPCSPTGGKIKGVGVRSDGKDIMTDVYPKGETIITWTFTDAAGASSVCKQTITILDTIKPSFDCSEILDTTVALAPEQCELNLEEVLAVLGSHTAIDNCDGDIKGVPMLRDEDEVTEIPLKEPFKSLRKDTTYHFIWHFVDKAGNDKTCEQYLTIADTTPPDASEACKNLTDKDVLAKNTCELPFESIDVDLNSTIEDLCDGTIKAKVQAFVKNYDGKIVRYDDEAIKNVMFPVGTHKFLYIYTDHANLSDTCVMYRTVKDGTKPEILDCFDGKDTVMGNVSSDVCGLTYEDLKDLIILPKAYDECDNLTNGGDILFIDPVVKRYFLNIETNKFDLVVDGNDNEEWKVEAFPVGLTKLKFIFSDQSGNVDSCIKYVNVIDDRGPSFDCSKIDPNPYYPVADPGECTVVVGDIWDILNGDYVATRSCTDETIPGVLTLYGTDKRIPEDYVFEVGRDYHLLWVFRSKIDGKVKTCDQIIRPNHQNPLEANCENAADIDTIKATEGRCDVPGDSVITKFPYGIDVCTKDTIWGVPHRSDSLEISDPFPTGHTHITWTMVSPYNVEDTARCEQNINIKGNKHFDLNCDELTPAMHRVVDVCGPIVMSDTLNTPEIADPCANPDSSYYMRPGVGTRSDDKTKDPINDEYPLGQTWIQWVFTDFTGAVSDTCDQLVDVRTKLPLKVDCDSINKDTIVIAVAEGTCDVPAPQVMDSLINRGYPFAKHPCLTDTFVGVPTRPNGLTMDDPYHVGPNEIIWVFTDKKTHTLVDSVITCTQIVQVGDINVPPVDCSQMPDTSIILDPYDCDINFSEMNFNIKPVYDLCSGTHIDSVVTRASMPGQSSEFGDPILEVPFGVGVDTVYWKYDFGSYKFLCTQVITVKDSMEPVVDCDTILDEEIVLPEGICEIQKDMVLDSIKQPYAYEYCSNLEIKGIPQLVTISSTEDTTYSNLPSKFNVGEPYKISWLFELDSLTVLSKRCDIDLTIKSSTKPIFDCSVFKDTVKKYAEGECDVVLDDQILPIQEGKDACVKDYIVYGKAYKVDTVDNKPTYSLLVEMNEGTPSYKVEKLEVGVYHIAWVFESKYSIATDTCNEILNILTDKKIDIACVELPTFAPTSEDSCTISVALDIPVAKNPCTQEVILPDTVIRSDKVPFKGVDDTFFVGKTTVYWIYVDHSKTLKDSIDTCVQIVQVGDVKEEPIKCPKDTLVTLPIGVCQLHPDSIHLNATEPTFRDFCADTIVPLLKVWRASGKLITEPFDLGIDTIFREYFYHGVQYICEQQIKVRNAGIDSFNCDMLGKSKNDTVTVELKTAGNTVSYSEVERMGFTKPDLVKLNACGQLVDTFMRSDNLKLEDPYPLGETTITYVVKDTTHGSEQSKTCERIINVINTGAPVMKCPPLADQKYICHKEIPASYNSFEEFISAGGSFNAKDGTPAPELVVPTTFKVDSVILDVLNNKVNKIDLCEFTLIRTYSALDVRNQEVTPCSDTFRVKDSVPPVWGIGVKSTVETFVCTPTQPFDHSVMRASDDCWGAVYSTPTEKTKTTVLKSGIFYTDSTNRSNDPNMCEYYNYDVVRRFVAYDACNNHSDTIKYIRRMRDTVPPTISVPSSFENAMIQADYTTPCIFMVPDVKGLLSPDIISENCPEYTMKPYKFTQVPPAGEVLHTEDGYVDVSIIIEDSCGFNASIVKRVIVPTRKSVVSMHMNDVTICADPDITLNSPLISSYSGNIWQWDKYEGEYVYIKTGSVVFDYYRDTLGSENLIYSNDMSSNGWKFEQYRAKEYLALDSYYKSDRYYIVITDTIRLCRDTAFAQITIHDRPSVSLTPEVYRICEDDSLHLSSEFEDEDLYTKFDVKLFDMGDSITKEGWLLGGEVYEPGTLIPYSDTLVSLKYYAINGCGMSSSGQSIGVSTLEKMRPENLMLVTDPQDKPRVFRNEPADLKLITKYRPFEYHWYKVIGTFDGRYDETFDKEGGIKDKYKDLIDEPDSLLGINYWDEPMSNMYQLTDLQDTSSYYVLMIDSVCPAVPSNVVSINVVKDIPTAFTPSNSLGMNDVFMEGYPVIIFNRYGQKMVESDNGWDGKCRGELVDPGVYFYELVLRDKSKHKGTIEVVYFK